MAFIVFPVGAYSTQKISSATIHVTAAASLLVAAACGKDKRLKGRVTYRITLTEI